jgi:hypothetical protein
MRGLAATLTGEDQLELPGSIQKDMNVFIGIMEADPPQTREILKAMGISLVSTEKLLDQLKFSFRLE